MRTSNSIKNIIIAILSNLIVILVGFISQKVFITSLGKEYLGINGLFSNILSILSVVELGFGTAIIYHLYKPLEKKDTKEIKLLLKMYKNTYRIIALIIFVLGIFILPFIKNLAGSTNIKENIKFMFFLALIEIVVSYLLTYKRSILYADQKTYIINIVHTIYVVALNLFEVVFLITTHDFTIYLIIKIIFRVLENLIITFIANKKYPYIKEKTNGNISSELKKDIYIKVKGLLLHSIASALVLSTDNLIISNLFGVVTVGLYSNYYMIFNALNILLGQAFNSITASIGNLLIENNNQKSFEVYSNLLLFNSWIYCVTGICILCLIEPFIKLWIGEEFLLPSSILIVLVINYYIQGMRKTNARFKEAAGIFYEDRFVPILESLINLIFSIILGKMMGLIGVFIGTICSSLILYLYSYPIYVYKKLFNRQYKEFIIKHIFYFLVSLSSAFISYIICHYIIISNIYLKLFIYLIVSISIPNIVYFIVFRKSKEFVYYKKLVNKFCYNIKEKLKKTE